MALTKSDRDWIARGIKAKSFQIITLLSRAQAPKEMESLVKQPLTVFENVSFTNFPMVERRKNILLRKSVSGITFYDSVIHFDPDVNLSNDLFVNCVFILPWQENPSKTLQQIGTTLLAADLSKVTLNAS
jgi:hypothetical protein